MYLLFHESVLPKNQVFNRHCFMSWRRQLSNWMNKKCGFNFIVFLFSMACYCWSDDVLAFGIVWDGRLIVLRNSICPEINDSGLKEQRKKRVQGSQACTLSWIKHPCSHILKRVCEKTKCCFSHVTLLTV